MVSDLLDIKLFKEKYLEMAKLYDDVLMRFHIEQVASAVNADALDIAPDIYVNFVMYGIFKSDDGYRWLNKFNLWWCLQTYIKTSLLVNNIGVIDLLKDRSTLPKYVTVPSEIPDFSPFEKEGSPLTVDNANPHIDLLDNYTKQYNASVYLWCIKMQTNNIINSNSNYSIDKSTVLNDIINFANAIEIVFTSKDMQPHLSLLVDYFNEYMSDNCFNKKYEVTNYAPFLMGIEQSIYKLASARGGGN
jgi:hypothetical protein